MRILVLKNLIVHRERNQLTAIIQTLTLAAIIFLITMLNLEVQQFVSFDDMRGVDFYIRNVDRQDVEGIISDYSYGIKDWGWITDRNYVDYD